ncbi:hypothetical protein E2562_017670 [Oryza meyeriana var. granulata]|uniref:IPT/TIG domain-containing protein n=1 Tax=Oryza meyeriana var. granulata TaxID=110450 RepID=A0A6G1BXR3_9ORYZ|nr:hypothetical protein E2562_017670 [Oryza meyeriana var. granulata]
MAMVTVTTRGVVLGRPLALVLLNHLFPAAATPFDKSPPIHARCVNVQDTVLTVAGSNFGGSIGIKADFKAFSRFPLGL